MQPCYDTKCTPEPMGCLEPPAQNKVIPWHFQLLARHHRHAVTLVAFAEVFAFCSKGARMLSSFCSIAIAPVCHGSPEA